MRRFLPPIVFSLVACSDAMNGGDASTAPPGSAGAALWQLPRGATDDVYAMPYPDDVLRDPDGTANLERLVPRGRNTLVDSYLAALHGRIDGFSPIAAEYLRLPAAIDPGTLPRDAAASTAVGASVQLLDVDPTSPDVGTRRPLQFFFRADATRYWPANTLAVAPAYGFPLRNHTKYALVVTRALRASDGRTFEASADLSAVLASDGGDSAVAAARAIHEPAVRVVEAHGVARDTIVSLAVFTTQDATSEMYRAVRQVQTTAPVPAFVDIALDPAVRPAYRVYTGHYGPSPVYQTGVPPYRDAGSGGFTLDAQGNPVMQSMINIAFALAVPTGEAPANGWPIAIYAHGTGGDATSHVSDGTADALASHGVASIGFDQVFNGERTSAGSSADADFFNFLNPLAGRTNNRQAVLDMVQIGRLVRRMTVASSVAVDGREVHFDSRHVVFFGHSQGSLAGPLWLSAEDGASSAVLSGAGATLALSLTQKTAPVDIPTLVSTVLGIPAHTTGDFGPLHPVVSLLQTAVDVTDPANYAREVFREPRAGVHAKSVYITQGFVDHYAPPESIGSLALALGAQLSGTVLHPEDLYALESQSVGTFPIRGNQSGGTITAVWQQFNARAGHDGHFVVFDIAEARTRAALFVQTGTADSEGLPTAQ